MTPTCKMMTQGVLVTMTWHPDPDDDDLEAKRGHEQQTQEAGGQRGRSEDLVLAMTHCY